MTFKAIAKRVGKDQTTISKEIKKHTTVSPADIPVKFRKDGTVSPNQPCPQLISAPYIQESHITAWVEMDTVIGRIGRQSDHDF